MNDMNPAGNIARSFTFGVSRVHFMERTAESAGEALPSYWMLLTFLILLYANTPFILPAAEVFRPAKVVAAVAVLAFVFELALGKRKLDWSWPEGGLLLAFLAAAAASSLTALWPAYAVDAAVELAKMVIVYFFIVNCASTDRLLRGVMWVMVIGGLFPSLGTLNNYLQGNLDEGRAAWVGIFANPNEVAYALVILLPLATYLAVSGGWFTRLLLLSLSSLFLAAIFVTFSRGGLVGLASVIGLYAWRKKNLWIRFALILTVAAGMVFAGKYWSRGEDFSELSGDATVQQRLATSQAGLSMFLDRPLLGVGLHCSVIAWPLYAPKGMYSRGDLITHNTLIQLLSETGVLGFLPFVALLGVSLYRARSLALQAERSDLGIAVEGALWGLVICGLSGGYVLTWFPYLLVGLAAAAHRLKGANA